MTSVWSATAGQGTGPHVTLIHGSLDRSAGLLKLSRRLVGAHRVTRYDRRGYGRSVGSEGPFGIDAHADDLEALLREVGPDESGSVLVGHSYGGNVALAVAGRHPQLVAAVVTYETPLSWVDWWPDDSAGSDALGWRADPADAAERFMRRLIGDDRWARLPEATRRSRRAEGVAMVAELLDLRANPAWDPWEVTVPVLALHGEHGQEHHRRAAEWIADQVPDGELGCLRGARHAGPNTHPDAVAEMVGAFVARRVRPTISP